MVILNEEQTQLAGATITLYRDADSRTIEVCNNVTLGLNGFTCSVTASDGNVDISEGAKLTLKDTSENGGGKIIASQVVRVEGEFICDGVDLPDIYISGGTANITNSEITGKSGTDIRISSNGGTVSLGDGVTFSDGLTLEIDKELIEDGAVSFNIADILANGVVLYNKTTDKIITEAELTPPEDENGSTYEVIVIRLSSTKLKLRSKKLKQ